MAIGTALRRMAEVVVIGDGSTFSSSDFITWSQADSGVRGTKQEFSGLTTVYRAINFLANTQATLELEAYRRSDRALVRSLLLEAPSPNWQFTCAEWRDYELRSRLLYGNSFAIKDGMTPASPWPRYLHPIHPVRVTPYGIYRAHRLVEVMYLVSPSTSSFLPPGATTVDTLMSAIDDGWLWLGRDQMFHVPGQDFDGVTGTSPIDACAIALAIELATELASAKFFAKGQMLSGFLKTPKRLDENEAKALRRRWTQKMAGIDNAFDVAVMDNGLEFQALSISPEQSQFIEMRQFNVEQVARIFGIPPFLLMASNAGNAFGTGLEQQLTATDIFTLSYWFKILESRVTLELLPGTQYAQFDKSPLVRADLKSRWASYAIGRQNQLISVNEVREAENLPRIDDADADDPMLPPPKGSDAADPGGNAGLQGGGTEATPDVTG